MILLTLLDLLDSLILVWVFLTRSKLSLMSIRMDFFPQTPAQQIPHSHSDNGRRICIKWIATTNLFNERSIQVYRLGLHPTDHLHVICFYTVQQRNCLGVILCCTLHDNLGLLKNQTSMLYSVQPQKKSAFAPHPSELPKDDGSKPLRAQVVSTILLL